MALYELSEIERDAVLAGLRLWQHHLDGSKPDVAGLFEIAQNGRDGPFCHLDEDAIGDLCEAINMGGRTPKTGKRTVWVLSTCVPNESEPCWPQAFGSQKAADAGFLEAMQSEWTSNEPRDEETDEPLPFPKDSSGNDDPNEAHEILKRYCGDGWGEWEITSHVVDLPDPAPAPDPCDMGPPPPCPEGLTLYRAEVVQDCNAYTRAWVAGTSPEDALSKLRHARLYGGPSVALTDWTEHSHGDPFDSAELRIYAADDEDMGDELASEED